MFLGIIHIFLIHFTHLLPFLDNLNYFQIDRFFLLPAIKPSTEFFIAVHPSLKLLHICNYFYFFDILLVKTLFHFPIVLYTGFS